MRYWFHPESDSLFTGKDEENFDDGLVVELTKEEYEELKEKRGE
jgi:hypothetical protein